MVDKSELRLPAALVILDGFGIERAGEGNAISLAHTPVLDALIARAPHIQLAASGLDVGLPAGQMGNSEVGHLNIGAGRVVNQELTRIDTACADGSLAQNEVLQNAFDAARKPGCALHLMGLLSDGGVHSHNTHLYAIIDAAAAAGVRDIRVHAFMDGRDVSPTSGHGFLQALQDNLDRTVEKYSKDGEGEGREGAAPTSRDAASHTQTAPTFTAKIASVQGRYFAMDRDNRWERVARAYNNIVAPDGANIVAGESAAGVVRDSYAAGTTDEFIEPVAFDARGVQTGDAVVFFNFRPDRARELTYAFTDPDFDKFARIRAPRVTYVCLTEYDSALEVPVAFPKTFPQNVLADVLAQAGLAQYHIAETEKYAHVTFFLNGGVEAQKTGERRVLIPSPKVATYDLQPEMSAPDVAETLAAAIRADEADVYIVNFANCDMVGHTGVIGAAVEAVEAVDAALGKVLSALKDKGGLGLVTADHGNADQMLTAKGTPMTAHTTAPVPLILANYTGETLTFTNKGGEGGRRDLEGHKSEYLQNLASVTAHEAAPSANSAKARISAPSKTLRIEGEGGHEGEGGVAPSPLTEPAPQVQGRLADIAPTLLDLIGLQAPPEMTGKSLLAK